MTLLPADQKDIQAVPLEPGTEPYEIPPYCAHPECSQNAVDIHEVARRSHMGGVHWWIEIGGVTVGNRAGLCRSHHRDVTEDRAWIRFVEPENRYLWLVRVDSDRGLRAVDGDWEALGELDPHPPVLTFEDLERVEGELAIYQRRASECLHPSLEPGQKCPGCNFRKPHPRKESSPQTRQFGFHVPDEHDGTSVPSPAQEFEDMEWAVWTHMGLVQNGRALKHARYKAVLTGYALILRETQPERAA